VWTPSAREAKLAVAADPALADPDNVTGEQQHGSTDHLLHQTAQRQLALRAPKASELSSLLHGDRDPTQARAGCDTVSEALQRLEKQSLFHNPSPTPRVSLKHEMSELRW